MLFWGTEWGFFFFGGGGGGVAFLDKMEKDQITEKKHKNEQIKQQQHIDRKAKRDRHDAKGNLVAVCTVESF